MKAHLKSTFCPECQIPAGKGRVASSHWKQVKRNIEKFTHVMTTPMSILNEKTAVELTSLLCNVFNRSNKKGPHVAQLIAIAIPKWNPRPRNGPFLEPPGTLVTPRMGVKWNEKWMVNDSFSLVFLRKNEHFVKMWWLEQKIDAYGPLVGHHLTWKWRRWNMKAHESQNLNVLPVIE